MFRNRSQFVTNILSNVGGNSVNSVLQLLLLLALARWLDTTTYAAYLTASALIGIAEIASDFGTKMWATRKFSSPVDINHTFRQCVGAKMFYTLATIVVLCPLPSKMLSFSVLMLSLLVASTQPSTDPFLWFLRSQDRLDIEAILVLAYRLTVAAALLIAACLGADIDVLLWLWLLCNLLRIVVEGRMQIIQPVFRFNPESPVHLKHVTATVSEAFPIGASLFLTALYPRIGILLLERFGTVEDVAVFGTAFRLVNAAGFVATSIVLSSFPRLVRAIESQDHSAVRQVISRKLCLVTAILAPVCIVGVFLSVPLAERLFSGHLADCGRIIAMLMPGLYLVCINMGVKFTLSAFGLDWYDFTAVLPGFVIFLTFTGLSVSIPWPARVAIGWSLGELGIMFFRLGFLRKHRFHKGVPFGVILGTTAILLFAVIHQGRCP